MRNNKTVAKTATKTWVILPDPHCHWQHNNDRADWASALLDDIRPDVVVNLGDHWDMPSLAFWDKGSWKAAADMRTYKKDVAVGIDFNERLFASLEKAKRRWSPKRILLCGNHEYRITRCIDGDRQLIGLLGYEDLQIERFYDTWVLYEGNSPGVYMQDDIALAHHFSNAMGGNLGGSLHGAHNLNCKLHVSNISGHSHILDFKVGTTAGGKKISGLIAGIYTDQFMQYAGGMNNRNWWRGLVILRNVEGGNYDPEFVSLDSLRRMYGPADVEQLPRSTVHRIADRFATAAA